MKKILILAFTDLSTDPRVRRQIRFLQDEYRITTVGTKDPQIKGVYFVDCGRISRSRSEKSRDIFKLILGKYDEYYWSTPYIKHCLSILMDSDFDIIIANDIESLPLALEVSKKAKVIFDAHEYAPREFDEVLLWRILFKKYKEYLCKKYINEADAMMTVCEGIADEYEKNYGVKPVVLTNAPEYMDIKPRETDKSQIKIIHHGGANPSRKLEKMIDIMKYLDDRFCLDFMLVGDDNYISRLKQKAEENPRIKFIQPVPVEEICGFISGYDIGIYILEPNNFNNKMALPNKFFEFIQARLAVAIGPSSEMAKIVKQYDCGIVAEDFSPESMAKCLNSLDSEKIDYHKGQSDKLAKIVCAENNKEIVKGLITSVLEQ